MNTRTNIIISLATIALSTALMSGNAAAAECKGLMVNASGESAGAVASVHGQPCAG